MGLTCGLGGVYWMWDAGVMRMPDDDLMQVTVTPNEGAEHLWPQAAAFEALVNHMLAGPRAQAVFQDMLRGAVNVFALSVFEGIPIEEVEFDASPYMERLGAAMREDADAT